MSKGTATRDQILGEASALASQVGLEGLTIGGLADALAMSKSGLFAHFHSKEALQIQVLDHAARWFEDVVVKPSLKAPRGEPRVRELCERWFAWDRGEVLPGGCIFIAAAAELDDQPGPVRAHLVAIYQAWYATLERVFDAGVESGAFRSDLDVTQYAQDLAGIFLALHHRMRLMGDTNAEARAHSAVERMLASARATASARE